MIRTAWSVRPCRQLAKYNTTGRLEGRLNTMPGDARRITIKDDLGDRFEFDAPPSRIVSLVPSITETLFELGGGDRVVGVTDYCIHPRDGVGDIPKLGGTKQVILDRVAGLEPDLAVANKEENRRSDVDQLRRVCPVFVTDPRTVEQAAKTVLDLGILTGCTKEAAGISALIESMLSTIQPAVLKRRLRTACFVWRDPWMAVGPDTYVADLLDTFGFENVFTDNDGRYPCTTLEAVLDRRPEVVMLPDEPFAFGPSEAREIETCFVERGAPVEILAMDGTLLTWFGYRTARGLEYLRRAKTRLLANKE